MQHWPGSGKGGLNARCAIAVMAKAPRSGKVKTRLVPPLTFDSAMDLSIGFLGDITENIALAGRLQAIDGYVAYAPAGTAALFKGLTATQTRLVLADGSGDMPDGVQGFGRSLLHAARGLFDVGYGAVCLLNADSPTLPTALLAHAAASLAGPGDRAVLGPAEDGGYYLLGMKAPHAHLFSDIAWSTEVVADQTRTRAREARLELVEMPAWYDVDDHAALLRLLQSFKARLGGVPPCGDVLVPFPAPATAACAARLRLDLLLGNAPE